MVVQELCRQLPMIDFQNTAQLLAVGVPGANALSAIQSRSAGKLSACKTGAKCLLDCDETLLEVSSLLMWALMRNAGVQVASGSATGLAGAAGLANAPQPPGRSALLYDMHTGAPRLHLVTAHDLDFTGAGARCFVDCMGCVVIRVCSAQQLVDSLPTYIVRSLQMPGAVMCRRLHLTPTVSVWPRCRSRRCRLSRPQQPAWAGRPPVPWSQSAALCGSGPWSLASRSGCSSCGAPCRSSRPFAKQ